MDTSKQPNPSKMSQLNEIEELVENRFISVFALSQSPIVSLLNQNKGKSLESAPLTQQLVLLHVNK